MSDDTRRATGRPSAYSEELADALFEMIVTGQSLTAICQREDMPHKATVYRWLGQNEEFRRRYAMACEYRAEHLGDEIIDIADNGAPDDTQRARLMVSTRQWLMAKMAPKKYGDKITNEIGGIEGSSIPVRVTTDLDRAKALAAMIAKTMANATPAE